VPEDNVVPLLTTLSLTPSPHFATMLGPILRSNAIQKAAILSAEIGPETGESTVDDNDDDDDEDEE
jgi:hypothetical protein